MNNKNKTLNVEDIENMSMSDIVDLYNSGYKLNNLDTSIQGLDISTWLQTDTCIGTIPNQMCLKNEYGVMAIGGVVALVLLLRK
jgi:hypothetical protein